MPKISTFLSDNMIENLKELSETSGKPLSKITSELIEIGYKTKQNDENKIHATSNEKLTELTFKSLEYLLRILNINSEILRKILNEPLKCLGDNADSILSEIKAHAENVVETTLKNPKSGSDLQL